MWNRYSTPNWLQIDQSLLTNLQQQIPTCAFGNVSLLQQELIGPPGTYFLCYRKLAEALQTRKLASQTHTFSTYYVTLLARTLATQPWRFARFSESEKSLYEFTLSAPSSSTTFTTESESYSILSPSGVWQTIETCFCRYTLCREGRVRRDELGRQPSLVLR